MKNEEEKIKPKQRSNQVYNALMIIGLMVLLALILLGVFGNAGRAVTNFFVGTFGFAIYGYCFAALAIGVLMLLGFRPRVSFKIVLLYIVALVLVIAMCHMATAKSYAHLGYGEYLAACYRNHNTAAGALGGLLFYVFGKAYVVCMVFAALFLLGIIALAIVSQVNHELNFRTFGASRRKKKPRETASVNAEFREAPMREREQEPARTLYNATIDGKPLKDAIGHSVLGGSRPVDYTPLDATLQARPIEPIEAVAPQQQTEFLVDPQEVDRSGEAARRRALDFLYNIEPPARPIRSEGMDVDVSRTVERLHGNNASSIGQSGQASKPTLAPQEPAAPSQPEELDDKYKFYSNNYRLQQLRAQAQLERQQHDAPAETAQSGCDETQSFLDDMERSLNQGLFGTSDTSASESVEPARESEPQSLSAPQEPVEDLTATNSEPLESFEDLLNRREEERKAKELEERKARMREELARRRAQAEQKSAAQAQSTVARQPIAPPPVTPAPAPVVAPQPPKQTPVAPIVPPAPPKPKKRAPYVPPDLACLRDYKEEVTDDIGIQDKIRAFESKMAESNIDVKVVNVVKGPTFTRIEFETTTQVSKITSRVNDITMWLEVQSLRLLAPIPGKGCCGIEIPNAKRGTVGLKTIVNSPAFNDTKPGGLYFALGKDIDGRCYVSDLTKFPHGLVAGASGAGKSVCLNAMLCSMLYKYSPEDLRLILVDPKVVEFNVYRDIPHLLLPNIITDEKQVINALKWAVDEMERRYQMLTELYVSNIVQYNNERPADKEKMPYIVVVIDEVGDIILSPVGKEFETLVKRLAAKARAAGIHLILATQRPSVDVITGTIKSNLPTRIAFAVTSGVDSKTILDSYGAEKLLRLGDMLYRDTSVSATPVRVQGAFIDNPEVREIVKQVRERNEAIFDESISAAIMTVEEPKPDHAEVAAKPQSSLPDTMCVDALEVGLANKTLSISFLQRKLGLGFQRAGKIIDWMKDMGYLRSDGKANVFALSEEEVEEIKRKENDGEAQ